MICIDTTVMIDFLRNDAAAVHAIDELGRDERLATTAINAAELLLGLYGVKGIPKGRVTVAQNLLLSTLMLDLDLNNRRSETGGI
ncbi:PIN domain-containing protein [Candidatus Woesearchaeota archaeon]|nr:PIN domain-containing protein [Candidatus Woesearchaeota archaeon]